MPRSKVNLYSYPWRVTLTLGGTSAENYNMPFAEADFRAYKGSTTNIDFELKDTDRRPVNLVGKSVVCTMLDHENRFEVLTKSMVVVNDIKGKLQLQLSPTDIGGLDEGWYDYVVLLENEDGTQNVLYTDQTMTARGYFEVIGDTLPPNAEATDSGDPMTEWLAHTNSETHITTWCSGAIAGDALFGDELGLHTVAIYLENYTGTFKIQGSLEQSPPTNEDAWFDIHLTPNTFELVFDNKSGIEAFNFTAGVTWLRFCRTEGALNSGIMTRVLIKR